MNIALILSGGTGTRMGGAVPKQYIEVLDKPIIAYALSCFEHHAMIDKIQIVADAVWQDTILPWTGKKFSGFSKPGVNRQLSILNGLQDILEYASGMDKVIIHDAARPCVTEQTITACLNALEKYEGVLPVLSMKDTVYESENGRICSLLNRSRLVAGQAPEGFLIGKYYRANLDLLPERILQIKGSTEPAVIAGMDVACISGDESNFKITTKEDLERFEQLMAQRGKE